MNPDVMLHRYRSEFPDMYEDEQCILIPDKFAKARHHWLVIARDPGKLPSQTAGISAPWDRSDKPGVHSLIPIHVSYSRRRGWASYFSFAASLATL